MRIPSRLQEKLSQYPELHAGVLASITQIEPWVSASTLPFFPEYTEHGIPHLEAVLATAEALIRDEAWPSLTPADAAALTLAVLLHDLAMHLTEDGFNELIGSSDASPAVDGFPDKPWPVLWADFVSETRRWDGRKLNELFGDTRPVRVPPQDPNDMTRRDRLLIGEFLRRHHHRLAHEIAIHGVPGPTENRVRLREVPDWLANLSGLVARSHGMPLREALPPLEREFGLREFRGVRAPFLMVVLRVADYLQVQAERAPAQVLQVARIRSPVSMREWEAHGSILDIQNTHADPEAIFLVARPPTVRAFLKVQQWQAGIQAELDVGWAVIGEVYGRYQGLANLGLVIRRVRSSLDDSAEFARHVDYIPRRAAFESAGAELLKLLIAPLYGNRPAVGVRELEQNALDAVLERREFSRALADAQPEDATDAPDVGISVFRDPEGVFWLEVIDRGIGMTPDVVVDYFLRAGASYRRSLEWHEHFEDEEGHSLVRRSGRFGVGALAAFLLGSEMSVATRHVTMEHGIAFTATVDTEAIQLSRIEAPIGTTIRVRLSPEAVNVLTENATQYRSDVGPETWDWYCLADPRVDRSISDRRLQQRFLLPAANQPLSYPWRRIEHPDFEDVQWAYTTAPGLVCNGITVMGARSQSPVLWQRNGSLHLLRMPRISVFDRDGLLPLNLQRDGLSERTYPFREQLMRSVAQDVLAWMSVFGPTRPLDDISTIHQYVTHRHPAVVRAESRSGTEHLQMFSTESGWAFADPWNISHINGRAILFLPNGIDSDWVPELRFDRDYAVYPERMQSGEISVREWVRFMMGRVGYSSHHRRASFPFHSLAIRGRRILLRKVDADALREPRKIPSALRNAIEEEWDRNGWVLWKIGECPSANLDFEAVASLPPSTAPRWEAVQALAEWYPEPAEPRPPESPLAEEWSSAFGSAFMGYDPALRKARLCDHPVMGELVKQYEQLPASELKSPYSMF
jgi:molecular chaperone HtpG